VVQDGKVIVLFIAAPSNVFFWRLAINAETGLPMGPYLVLRFQPIIWKYEDLNTKFKRPII